MVSLTAGAPRMATLRASLFAVHMPVRVLHDGRIPRAGTGAASWRLARGLTHESSRSRPSLPGGVPGVCRSFQIRHWRSSAEAATPFWKMEFGSAACERPEWLLLQCQPFENKRSEGLVEAAGLVLSHPAASGAALCPIQVVWVQDGSASLHKTLLGADRDTRVGGVLGSKGADEREPGPVLRPEEVEAQVLLRRGRHHLPLLPGQGSPLKVHHLRKISR